MSHQIVLDTNVLIAALRTRRGASFRLPSILGKRPDVRLQLSVPVVLEYEATAVAQAGELGLTAADIGIVLDYLCAIADHHEIFYLWRPVLRDPNDDLLLELAVAAGCRTIITYDKRDFQGAEAFGVRVETAREFLSRIGELT